ncbi:hypothetical protein [Streptomyces sp. MST-110588]|uniref:hypothetical protein n=1 Tax=Streptomyces sp. MST-110588 TaxID=2833628 RepID=UPI001F5CAEB8|nr:hypothetical protein [Streptomyces sp. MST-110588]UNO41636.1 hypothetical protein KGS77_21405 [Streptomyces sp. MST-110588]
MTAIALALLLAAAVAVALGAAALHTARALRRQLTELRAELAASVQARTGAAEGTAADGAGASIPAARAACATPLADIRAAVADALAEERERELAEARAFWAAQEARDAADAPSLLGGAGGPAGPAEDGFLEGLPERWDQLGQVDRLYTYERPDSRLFLPRQADLAGLEPLLGPDALEPLPLDPSPLESSSQESSSREPSSPESSSLESVDALEAVDAPETGPLEEPESAELAAARRRHPSHPDFSPARAVGDQERTVDRLEELARERIPLTDVRPGPLGTLDVYVFGDGTTVCMTPGHRETAERLAAALREGRTPVLLGGSGVFGAYALTFAWGESAAESIYILADRVIASL